MSGHSHWATIKRKKAKEDAKKGKVFTRFIREIMVVARDGGGDPAGNARLRLLIEKARAANMPSDNIARAIKRGTGEVGGSQYEDITYEGYGPEGMAIVVEALTDNKNRTISDVRHAFSKYDGKIAGGGAVSWMFDRKGVIWVKKAAGLDEEVLLEKLIDYNIDDIVTTDDAFGIYCDIADLEVVKEGAEQAGLTVDSAELEWVPKEQITLSSQEATEKAYKLLEALEELDDVQNVFANIS